MEMEFKKLLNPENRIAALLERRRSVDVQIDSMKSKISERANYASAFQLAAWKKNLRGLRWLRKFYSITIKTYRNGNIR